MAASVSIQRMTPGQVNCFPHLVTARSSPNQDCIRVTHQLSLPACLPLVLSRPHLFSSGVADPPFNGTATSFLNHPAASESLPFLAHSKGGLHARSPNLISAHNGAACVTTLELGSTRAEHGSPPACRKRIPTKTASFISLIQVCTGGLGLCQQTRTRNRSRSVSLTGHLLAGLGADLDTLSPSSFLADPRASLSIEPGDADLDR
eukprot:317290-Rhodomonas_salina.1